MLQFLQDRDPLSWRLIHPDVSRLICMHMDAQGLEHPVPAE